MLSVPPSLDYFVNVVTFTSIIGTKAFSDVYVRVLLDFSLTVKAAPHECVIRTSQLWV